MRLRNIKEQTVENMLITLRHVLAHGNVLHLNGEGGDEAPGRQVTHMAFVVNGHGSEAYRALIVEAVALVRFLEAWAN